MKLPSGWYAILSSHELTQFEPFGVKRLGRELVLWRNQQGAPVVMIDKCPHRSAKLSKGKIKNGRIQCAFHGFEYDTDGRCQFVPETQKPAENLKVKTFASVEFNNFIWIWNGSGKVAASPPWFSDIDDKFIYSQIADTWSCHVTRCIESRLDYAHLPFVHPNSFGKNVDVTKKATVESGSNSIRVTPKYTEPSSFYVDFLFPGLMRMHLDSNKNTLLTFSPIDDSKTIIYVRTYYKGIKFSLIKEFVDWSYNSANEIMMKELKDVVESQGGGSSYESDDERLFISDIPIRNFREKWLGFIQKAEVKQRVVKKRTYDPDQDFAEPLESNSGLAFE